MSNKKPTIQEYLSLGYIYLIVLGLTTEVIYYKFLGINILNYASILDVLISPINILTRDAKSFIFLLVLLTVLTYSMIHLIPKLHEWEKRFKWYRKMYDMDKLDAKYAKKADFDGVVRLLALLLFSMFIGLSMGSAGKARDRIANNTFELSHQLTFQDGTQKSVKVIGQNSTFIFYVEKGDKEVTASPILANVKLIRKLPKKERK